MGARSNPGFSPRSKATANESEQERGQTTEEFDEFLERLRRSGGRPDEPPVAATGMVLHHLPSALAQSARRIWNGRSMPPVSRRCESRQANR